MPSPNPKVAAWRSPDSPMQTLHYKTFHGSSEHSPQDGCFHGTILFIDDLVTYESETLAGLQQEFEAAVEDYLETCEEVGKDPEDLHDLLLLREAKAEAYGKPLVSLGSNKSTLRKGGT